MKKYVFSILLTGVFYSTSVLGQITKAEIIYKVKIQRQDKNKEDKKPSKRVERVLEEVKNINLQLLYNNGKGSFKTEEALDVDYMSRLTRSSAKTIANVRDDYYYDVPEKKIVSDRELSGTSYNIVYRFDTFEWKLNNETKKIDEYLCYKATTTYSYKNRKGTITNLDVTAWYTPQIPMPLGPKNYTGLPGLVLELQEGAITIYVAELTLNPKRKITIEKAPEGEEVTEKEYEKIASEAYGNFIEAIKNE